MMARVFEVSAAAMRAASMLALSSSTSTNTGFAPSSTIISAVAMNVNGVGTTSSPGLTASAISAISRHSIHGATALQDLERRFVPARHARRRRMKSAFHLGAHQASRNGGDVRCPGRRAELVVHHAQRRAFLRLPQDGAHEVAALAIDPCGPDDQM